MEKSTQAIVSFGLIGCLFLTMLSGIVVIVGAFSLGLGLLGDFFSGASTLSENEKVAITEGYQPLCRIVTDDAVLNKIGKIENLEALKATSFYQKYSSVLQDKDENLKEIIRQSNDAGINAALLIAIWGKESTFSTTKKEFVFGYGVKSENKERFKGFSAQLKGAIETFLKTKNNEGSYAGRNPGEGIFERWHRSYTPMVGSEAEKNKADLKNLFSFLEGMLPAEAFKEIRSNDCLS
jgi:hypothetical protein